MAKLKHKNQQWNKKPNLVFSPVASSSRFEIGILVKDLSKLKEILTAVVVFSG